jgi:Transposase DDE domain
MSYLQPRTATGAEKASVHAVVAFILCNTDLAGTGGSRPIGAKLTWWTPPVEAVPRTPSASIRADGGARWAGHRRRKRTHGYKAHVATDEGAGLVRGVEATTANIHDAAELEAVLPPKPRNVQVALT